MTDVVGERWSESQNINTYLVVYVKVEKIYLSFTRRAHSAVSRDDNYERLWIRYYKNIANEFVVKVEY